MLLSSVLAATGAASAADTTTPPARVSFCGPVVQLVETGCFGVTVDQSHTYDITGVHPAPAAGMLISGSGEPGQMTMCNQGTHLSKVTWTKAKVCPRPPG
jgi:hypothetical protein